MALIGSAASDSAGFLVIAISPMGLFSNFGIYSAAMIVLSLIASLILTTAALGILSSIQEKKFDTTEE
jgi:predicted RND superfamily exporter protein